MGRTTLLLVPTDVERERIAGRGGFGDARVELAGFGPVAAAARTAALVARLRPARVLLVGIAGTYDSARHAVGTAVVFDEVAIHGVGAGEGARSLGPRDLGFPQWADAGAEPIWDRLALARGAAEGVARAGLLLTVTSASGDASEADERRRRHPSAAAEDMEGFAVALACALERVPCAIVRGISNRVGERAKESWDVAGALDAARRAALAVLADPQWDLRP